MQAVGLAIVSGASLESELEVVRGFYDGGGFQEGGGFAEWASQQQSHEHEL